MKYILLTGFNALVCMLLFLVLEFPSVLTHFASSAYFFCMFFPFVMLGYILVYESYKEFVPRSIKEVIKKHYILFLVGFGICLTLRYSLVDLNSKFPKLISYSAWGFGILFVFGMNFNPARADDSSPK